MISDETAIRAGYVLETAHAMICAARTAPKACGIDNLTLKAVDGEDLQRLAEAMREVGRQTGRAFFLRDADNVAASQAVVLIGTRTVPLGLDCGFCGFPTCAAKTQDSPATPCFFNSNDLGLATGSAVSVAADRRVDNRVMFSAGVAAREAGMMQGCDTVLAVALSCSGKSIYFDRQPVVQR